MDFDTWEKILNLLERCQAEGKALQISIDDDLVKIFPLPRKLLVDFVTDQLIPTFFRLSDDKKTILYENSLQLCPIDQHRGDSCRSPSCERLHICQNYLLKETCPEFNSLGKCSHSHSLLTHHNENVLRKYRLSAKDDQTFALVSRLIKLSLPNSRKIIVQTTNGQSITPQIIDGWLDQHKALLKSERPINSQTVELTFEDDEVASMMEDFINEHHSKTASIKKDLQLTDPPGNDSSWNKPSAERPSFGRGRGKQPMSAAPPLNNQSSPTSFSRRLRPSSEKKFTFSQRLSSIQNPSKSTDNETTTTDEQFSHAQRIPPTDENRESISPQNASFRQHYVLRDNSTRPKGKSSNDTLITYYYKRPFIDEHLCYLLGPGKRQIIEEEQCQIFCCLSLGYCRVRSFEEGKDIEKCLYEILPDSLNIEVLKTHEDLALVLCSSAAESIFQQNQIHYAIVSEPMKTSCKSIEVVHAPAIDRQQPSLMSNRNSASSTTDYESTEQSSSDGQFYIEPSGSSINIVSGDICEIPVDLLICISTSRNLRDSVLRCAGPNIERQYKKSSRPDDALLLDGGSTAARKILFVPWETDIEETETAKTQKSLSDLVKWSIDQAEERDLKSIAFPPIGTGQLGLDPAFVCEAMISAASERLHQCKLDVSFVIYPTTGIEEEDECYQVFRLYLESLCEPVKKTKASPTTSHHERKASKTREAKKESIRRGIQSKRISILSNSSNASKERNSLIQSLEDLMYEKTFDMSLIESSLIDQIDLVIDICLKFNVYPRLDYSRGELTLRGDRDSCFQCFFNLRQGKKVSQYAYQSNEREEKIISPYVSLKIDEALAVGESNVSVKDDEQTVYNIDLNKFQMRLTKDKQTISLARKQLNRDDRIAVPSFWSSSILTIQTIQLEKSSFETLECFPIFHETLPLSEWQIERIDSVENYPLYIHFKNNNKKNQTKLYFHGCSYASVQSIIHYGLHLTNASHYGDQHESSSIWLTRDALNSHLYGTRRSTDGKYYMFAVRIAQKETDDDFISLSNEEIHLALPTYLIVYHKRKDIR